jgi:hypothetical protein
MKKMLKKLVLGFVLVGFALAPVMANNLLNEFDLQLINEVEEAKRSFSHKDGLVNTINMFLDCAASGRIDVALIGWNEVPAPVVEMWQRQNPDSLEVSISKYSLALSAKIAHDRTDFYSFRSIEAGDRVVETLYQDVPSQQSPAVIAKMVNGDPYGKFKSLSDVLTDLQSFIEEGEIVSSDIRFNEVTQRVHDLWKNNCGLDLFEVDPAVTRFAVNCPSGYETFWRVTGRKDGFQTQIMIYRNQLIYINRNGQIEVK